MLSPDASHLSKYLTTLGVAIVAATLSFGGLFLRLQDGLLVSRKDLSGLTPTAQRTIRDKQSFVEFATNALPWFMACGIVLGLVMVVIGLRGWIGRQAEQDEADRATTRLTHGELRLLTAQERKLAAEAEERALAGTVAEHPGAPALQAELDVLDRVKAALGDTHKIEHGVEVRRDDDRYLIDVVGLSGSSTYLFDVKYLRHLKTFRSTMRRATMHLAGAVEVVGPSAVPCLVIAFGQSEPGQQAQAEELAQELAAELLPSLRVLVIDASKLSSIGRDDFREAFGIL